VVEVIAVIAASVQPDIFQPHFSNNQVVTSTAAASVHPISCAAVTSVNTNAYNRQYKLTATICVRVYIFVLNKRNI